MEIALNAGNWIAIIGLAITLIATIKKTSEKVGQQDQQLRVLQARSEEDRMNNAKKLDELDRRVTEQEKEGAVQSQQYESICQNMARIESSQKAQGEKLDRIAEAIATITESIKNRKE